MNLGKFNAHYIAHIEHFPLGMTECCFKLQNKHTKAVCNFSNLMLIYIFICF